MAAKRRMHWVYYFGRGLIRVIAFPFFSWKVRGRENLPEQGPALIVCNHLHIADPPIVASSLPLKAVFMAKEELWHNRWSRFWVENFEAFPVRRDSFDREAIRRAEKCLGKGFSLIMFPEGERSKTAKLKKALPGAALIALRTGVPIVPVAITGTENIKRLWWSFWHHPPITITIGKTFNPPATNGKITKEQRNQLCNDIMYTLAEMLPPDYRGIYDREKTTDNRESR
jgi:1-acyl-sn-glycerol-3-phosphate acyltransferase